ncbi:MAG: hypothetical protein ACI3Y0_09880 [Prevotella sp.]
MLQENIFNRQDNQVVAAADSQKKESLSKEHRAHDKDVKIIRQFLSSIGLYEADALRIAIALADGKISASSFSSNDMLALNRYLNFGINKQQNSSQQIQAHRIHRASELSKRVIDFCGKLQLLTVYESLMDLAVNATYVEQARAGLDKIKAESTTHKTNSYSPNSSVH